jgi:hypothetical protein
MKQQEREARLKDIRNVEAEAIRQQFQIQTMIRKIETLELSVDKLCVNKLKSGFSNEK